MNKDQVKKVNRTFELSIKGSEMKRASGGVAKSGTLEGIVRDFVEADRAKRSNDSVIRMYKALKSYVDGQSWPLSFQENLPESFSKTTTIKFVGKWQECLLPNLRYDVPATANNFSHLDFLSNIYQKEIDIKKTTAAELFDSINFEPLKVKDFWSESFNFDETEYLGTQGLRGLVDEVASSLDYNHEILSTDLFWENLRRIIEVVAIGEDIKEKQKFVDLIKTLKKLLCSVFRQFQINRRERFRKINSFLFKNLDDYHSLALTSAGY